MCFALLRAGADKNVLGCDGKTAQHLAQSKKRDKIAAVLDGWKPMGLTATQTQKITESRGEGPLRYSRNLVDGCESFERATTATRSPNSRRWQIHDDFNDCHWIGHRFVKYDRNQPPSMTWSTVLKPHGIETRNNSYNAYRWSTPSRLPV